MFELDFTESAIEDLRYLKKTEQNLILDSLEEQLTQEPLNVTKNRKPLRPNDISAWELRVDKYRVFYDVNMEDNLVIIKAVGWKEHNQLFIRGKESLAMRTIDLSTTNANLTEILSLAGDETVIIRTPDGREFVLSEVDDFAYEVALIAQNQELMAFLTERSKETKRHNISKVREMLNQE